MTIELLHAGVRRRRGWFGMGGIGPLGAGLLQALLVALLLADPSQLASAPIRSLDYAAHYYNALHAADHLRSSGRLWGYDPSWMIGFPQGLVALIDDKLFCMLLLAAPPGWEAIVFNAGVLGMILAVPWMIFGAARAAALEPRACAAGALTSVVATFTVPAAVLFWSWGGLSFFFASVLAVPVTVTLATVLRDRSLGSPRGVIGALGAMVVTFTHPVGAPIVAAGLLPLLWSGERPLSKRLRDLTILGALVALTVLPIIDALLWLRAPLRLSHPAHEAFRGGLGQLWRDWWTDLFDTTSRRDGAGGLVVVLPLAIVGVVGMLKRPEAHRPASAVPGIATQSILLAILFCGGIAYASSSLTERFVRLQPYRFLIPMTFFACIPAGAGLARAASLLAGRWVTASALLLAALAVIGNAARGLAPMLVLGHGEDPAEVAVAAFTARETSDADRILVESTVTGLWVAGPVTRAILSARFALLPTMVHREFLGYAGVEPFAAHRYARFDGDTLLGRKVASLSEEAFTAILRQYAISWVVGCQTRTIETLRRFTAVIEDAEAAGDCRIFRVRTPERSRFLEGSGRVSADLDRIRVEDAIGDRIVLKYHWLPTLRTDPPLPLEEAHQPGMPVGFIAVRPGGVREFTIRQRSLLELRR